MNISDINSIRNTIKFLYDTHSDIHVNVTLKQPHRITLYNLPVAIVGVYPHMFQVEDKSEGSPKQYMHQYTDLITKEVEILELTDIASKDDNQNK